MVFVEEDVEEKSLQEKMKKWGILKGEDIIPVDIPTKVLLEFLLTSGRSRLSWRPHDVDVQEEILDLKKRVCELERRVAEKRKPTKADYVYALFREGLEREHFGRIVAIDTQSREIVGIADTILEAYNEAKEKTGKDQFDFKRVGYKHMFKV